MDDIPIRSAFASAEDAATIATALAENGQTRAALTIYEDLRIAHPNWADGYRKAIHLLMRQGKSDEADRVLQQAQARFPEDAGFAFDRGWLELQRRDLPAAAAHWQAVRDRFPDHPVGYAGGGIALRESGKLDDADALLKSAVGRFPGDAGVAIEFARVAQRRNDWPAALARWQAVHSAFPDRGDGPTGVAFALAQLGRVKEADQTLAAAIVENPNDRACAIEAARLAMRSRDWATAINRWQHVRDNFPAASDGYIGGAQALRDSGRFPEADDLLRQAMALFPTESGPVSEYAWVAHIGRDWPEAQRRWAEVRARYPDQMVGYAKGAEALRNADRSAEAEAVLQQAAQSFPDDPAPPIEYARLAFARGDFQEALLRWERVRDRFPDLLVGYLESVHPLRELKRWADADAMVQEAMLRFPNEFDPAREFATLALHRRDWAKAARLFAILRARFADNPASYGGGILALRELRRFQDADALANAAIARFPGDIGFLIDHAWLAVVARDWDAAVARWAKVRATDAGRQEAYIQAARALRELWRHQEAEQLLAEAIQRFPGHAELAAEHAWIAMSENRWDDAAPRFAALRERFPSNPDGWLGGATILRNQFELVAAEAMLAEAMQRFPGHPQFVLDHAQLPVAPAFAEDKDWPETLRRIDHLHATFPTFETGLIVGVRLLQQAGQAERAEAVAAVATQRLPDSYALASQYAEAAEARQDWAETMVRYGALKQRFTDQPGGDIGLARALAAQRRYDEADAMLQKTIARFPGYPAPFLEYIDVAMRREDWKAALERSTDAVARFPQDKPIAQRAYDAKMRLSDDDPQAAIAFAAMAPAAMPDPDSTDQQVRDLAMQFESLGGRGLGCEFGIFQRDCGAEPLGLLRWADMPFDMLVQTLRTRFHDVGTEAQTELFVSRVGGGRGEYCTRDRRGMMFMRAFVYEDQATFEKMRVSTLNRLRFLTRKLIDDLETGSKIFVFRLTDRDLTDNEIDDLHAAMRSYGDNTLLYVRYEDQAHPNGTVEAVKPGLMIGYMDRFKLSRTDQLSSAPPTASWLAVCRNAYSLWRSAGQASSK